MISSHLGMQPFGQCLRESISNRFDEDGFVIIPCGFLDGRQCINAMNGDGETAHVICCRRNEISQGQLDTILLDRLLPQEFK